MPAIIYDAKPAYGGTFGNDTSKPVKKCPKCGEDLYRWKRGKFETEIEECFSSQCVAPYEIGRIYGDIASWDNEENTGNGWARIMYPAAKGAYSAQLREVIIEILTSWGFRNITIRDPDTEKHKSDTWECSVISAVHVSPRVNIAFRKGHHMQHSLCFLNKFGIVAFRSGKHDSHERDFRAWDEAYYAVSAWCNDQKIKIGSHDKIAVLDGRDALRNDAKEAVIKALKSRILAEITSERSEIQSMRSSIQRREEKIEQLKKKYVAEFGEPVPEKV